MELLINSDFELFSKYAGKAAEEVPNAHQELKVVYEKLGYICGLLPSESYKYHIIKNPRNLAQKFERYHWAKVYPKELLDSCENKICFVLGTDSDGLHIHIDGLKQAGYMNHPKVIPVRDDSYQYIDVENKSYEKIVEEVVSYMKDSENYNKLLNLGSSLGIDECVKILTEIKKQMHKQEIQKLVDLLQCKNQIILQGAPGTGKTYNAKLIAEKLLEEQLFEKEIPKSITKLDILNIFEVGLQIPSVSNHKKYKIAKVENEKIELSGDNIEPKYISFHKIISSYANKQWEPNKIINGLDSYEAALAYYIYNNISGVISNKDKAKYIKLVQFHPSYSYEDFVRGIVVSTDSGILRYVNQNKILGKFAKEALDNWIDSQKDSFTLTKEWTFELQLDEFKKIVDERIAAESIYKIEGTTAVITEVTDESFRFTYEHDKRVTYTLLFSDLVKLDNSNLEFKQVKDIDGIDLAMKRKASYYFRLFNEIKNINTKQNIEAIQVKKQNYILIIDEINRANLSAVLGELIYALEYRGEGVECMYTVDGSNNLVLPPNLFIIGTMNTADRSVGQIDYAIRRRFAFVDMLPKILYDEETFDKKLFVQVSSLFVKNIDQYIENNTIYIERSEYLSSEFRPEDVWIGHSYFIMKDNSRDIRLKYEIIPILKEYIKDGILKESARKVIENIQ